MSTNHSLINMQSFNGFLSSCLFIIIGHVSAVITAYETSEILQSTSYAMAIIVALDTLTGNPIKNTFKKICKTINDKKR